MYIYFTAKYFISYIPQVTLRPLIMSDFFRVTYYPSCVTLLALSSSNIFFLKMHLSQCDQFYFLIDNIFIYYVFWYQSVCKLVCVSIYFFIFLSANKLLWSMTKTQCQKFYHKLSWIKIKVCKLFSGKIAAYHQVVIRAPSANSWISSQN